jgi:phosphate transport system permease protein
MTTVHRPDRSHAALAPSGFTDIAAGRKARNRIATVLVCATMAVACVPLVWVLWELLRRGLPALLDGGWWAYDMLGQISSESGGGISHAIVGTLTQVVVTTLISVPVGVLVAVYLVEYARGGWLGRVTTFMVDILTGVPSIVAALFVYALWVTMFGFGRSGFAVSLALVLLMIPVTVRNTEEMLRIVPDDLREAAYALGVPKWKTILRVVLPTALSGIVTGVMLAVARVTGESAPVLVLVGATPVINWNLFEGPQNSLPLFMLQMYKEPASAEVLSRLWGAGLTLVIIIGALYLGARLISARFSVKAD